jgi:hypothetical protein
MLTVAIPVHLVQERGSVELYEVSSLFGQFKIESGLKPFVLLLSSSADSTSQCCYQTKQGRIFLICFKR